MKRSMLNRGYLHFALLLLLLFGVVQSSSAQAASSRQAATQEQTEQAEPDGSLPDAAQQIYLPLAQGGSAGNAIWSDVTESVVAAGASKRQIVPQKYRTVRLNVNALQQLIQATPQEASAAAQRAEVILSLPLPDGTLGRFRIVEAPVMAPELAAKFPEIKTYVGQGIDDPTATVRFDWTPTGFHAMILAASDTVFIDPYSRHDTVNYISYFKRDFARPANKLWRELGTSATDLPATSASAPIVQRSAAVSPPAMTLRKYRLAMAATKSYVDYFGGTVPGAMAAIVTSVNRVTGILESEVALRLELVANNDLLISTNAADYPSSGVCELVKNENQPRVDAIIGSNNYDIGHVFDVGGGGIGEGGSACDATRKAQGCTGTGDPAGDSFDLDFVAHELGHQLDAYHTFTGDGGICLDPYTDYSAYEPASGSTIMSYGGYCNEDNLVSSPVLPFYSAISHDQINNFLAGNGRDGHDGSCAIVIPTTNNSPTANAGTGGVTIPKSTAFQLTGSGSDPDGDAITYGWEQFNQGPQNFDSTDCTYVGPLFEFLPPVTTPVRLFPKLANILSNTTNQIGEVLPCTGRSMTFRLTVRDNRAGGGLTANGQININVAASAGPFKVTSPNSAVTWVQNSTQTVQWDVAGTNGAPVNATTIDILLSTDGGQTFPHILVAGAANDGSESVLVPTVLTTQARIKIAHALNATVTFLDISDQNFTIEAPPAMGTIIIRKTTSPAGGTGFGFTSNIPGATSFTLNHGQNQTVNNVTAGSYTVSENNPSGYSLTNLVCTDPSGGTTTNLGTRTATIGLAAGETVDCTFTNTQTGATPPIVISSDINGNVPGLSFRDEDIIIYSSGTWSMVFDGSDVGLGNVDVDGFAFLPNGQLLLSVDKDFTLSGFGPVDESDILNFIPSSYGPTTSGSYQMYFDGSDVGLSSSDEDVDAIDFDASGNLLISVNGAFKAQSVTGADEDLFALSGFTPGANTSGAWSLYFDGSDVGLTSSGEDIFGLWADHANSKLYLTTHDNFAVPGASGDEDDIFVCRYTSLGSTTACTFTLFWNGDNFGFDEDAIDGLSIGNPPTVVSAAESSGNVAVDDTVEYEGDDANEANPLDGEETATEEAQPNRIFLPLAQQ